MKYVCRFKLTQLVRPDWLPQNFCRLVHPVHTMLTQKNQLERMYSKYVSFCFEFQNQVLTEKIAFETK